MLEGSRIGPPDAPGRYRLIRPLGSGAEGGVWLGEVLLGPDDWEEVAVKILPPASRGAGDAVWERHVRLLSSLPGDPGLARVRETFIADEPVRDPTLVTDWPGAAVGQPSVRPAPGYRYVVMDFVRGANLAAWLRPATGPVPMPDRLRGLLPVAAALDRLHAGLAATRTPIVHGDVKPENIVVTDTGHGVLVDFGSAGLTGGRPRMGQTRAYAAPELIAGVTPTPASDRYAFAATVAYAVLARPPVSGPAGIDLDALDHDLAGSPTKLRRAILDALTVTPENRPAPLATWLSGLVRQPARRRTRLAVAGAAALVGALISGVVLAANGEETPHTPEARPSGSFVPPPSDPPSATVSAPSPAGTSTSAATTATPTKSSRSATPPVTATIRCQTSCSTTSRTVAVNGRYPALNRPFTDLQVFTHLGSSHFQGAVSSRTEQEWTGLVNVGNDNGKDPFISYGVCIYAIDAAYAKELKTIGNDTITQIPADHAKQLACTTINWTRPTDGG